MARIEFDDRNFQKLEKKEGKNLSKKYTLKNIYGSEQMVVVGADYEKKIMIYNTKIHLKK